MALNSRQTEMGLAGGTASAHAPAGQLPRVVRAKSLARAGSPSRATALLELALSVTGVGLSLFVVMHLGLLFSVLLGAGSFDALAGLLERFYLLQAVAPFVVLGGLVHVLLAMRKAPGSFRQQLTLLLQIRRYRHVDTWGWAIQLVSGLALLILLSIHLWIVLNDLPIEAAKSGARVYTGYLWFYIPFILFVEAHLSIGIYRVVVKWGLLTRRWAHTLLTLWTALALSLGFAILITFYFVGPTL